MSEPTHFQEGVTQRQFRTIMAGLLGVLTLASLDQNIVATALPGIVSELGGLSHLSWVVAAFALDRSADGSCSRCSWACSAPTRSPIRPSRRSGRLISAEPMVGSRWPISYGSPKNDLTVEDPVTARPYAALRGPGLDVVAGACRQPARRILRAPRRRGVAGSR